MNFDEHAAKSLVLAPAGIPVPRGQICRTAKEAAQSGSRDRTRRDQGTGWRPASAARPAASSPPIRRGAERVAAAILGMSIGEYKVERLLARNRRTSRMNSMRPS